jgi:O-antigen/teichoic acid export membrane protein
LADFLQAYVVHDEYAIICAVSDSHPKPLRKRVLQGSVYLTVRNGISMLLSLVGSLLVTRAIGPENYGLFTAAGGIFGYLLGLASQSTIAYLVREQSPGFIKRFHLAFWWLFGVGVGMVLVCIGVVLVMGLTSGQQRDFTLIVASLFVWLPAALISAVPQALLERNLEYRPLALIQIASQAATYLLAIPLAQMGFGAWALVWGFWLGQAVQLVGSFAAARYRPRWYWNRADWKQMMHYTVSQSLSVWLYNLRDLAPSLILFPLAGERAMGYYSLANRLVSMLSFLYSTAGRIAFAAFARLQDDKERFAKAIQEAIQYLVLFTGLILSVFSASVGVIAAWMLGPKWDALVIQQLCIVTASRVLLSSLSGVQTQALYVVGQNWLKVRANAVFAVLLAIAGGLLVGTVPVEHAPLMFALADHIAHAPTYWYDVHGVRKYIGRIDYRLSLLWLSAVHIALFAPLVSYWLYAAAVGLLLHPLSIQGLRDIMHSFKKDYFRRD